MKNAAGTHADLPTTVAPEKSVALQPLSTGMPRPHGSAASVQLAQSQGDMVYERLKADIVVCKFRPGDEITELGIADAYQVGRAPVRTALARLCQDRLLISERRRGHMVAPITVQSIKDVFSLRLILEPAAARSAVGRVDVAAMRALTANPGPVTDQQHTLEFLEENRQFHLTIVHACGNARLDRILTELYDEMNRMLHLGLYGQKDSTVMRFDHDDQERQHNAIIDAFEHEDGPAVEAAVREHIQSSHSLVVKNMLSGNLLFSF